MTATPPRRYGRCEDCGHLVVGWHSGCDGDAVPDESAEDRIDEYHDELSRAAKRIVSTLESRETGPPEWRTIPKFENYVMNGATREVWRRAYTVTLPSGRSRHYPVKRVEARNGSYSLTSGGVTTSRGIQALWRETFAEKSKKRSGHEIQPRRHEVDYYPGLAEWLAEGRAAIVTRPT